MIDVAVVRNLFLRTAHDALKLLGKVHEPRDAHDEEKKAEDRAELACATCKGKPSIVCEHGDALGLEEDAPMI